MLRLGIGLFKLTYENEIWQPAAFYPFIYGKVIRLRDLTIRMRIPLCIACAVGQDQLILMSRLNIEKHSREEKSTDITASRNYFTA